MDFSDFFTRSAREAVPWAWSRGLLFLFDCRGPPLEIDADEQALRRSLLRLLQAAPELLDEGSLFVTAHADWNNTGLADLAISIAGTGRRASDARLEAALRQLELAERAPAHDAPAGSRVAQGVCPITGAPVSFGADRQDGILFAIDLVVPARLQPVAPLPTAAGASAWLLFGTADASWSLARRLQRLGWRTTHFESAQDALQALNRRAPDAAAPSLVIGLRSGQLQAAGLQALKPLLGAGVPLILGAGPDAPVEQGTETRPWPFSPAELREWTRQVWERRARAPDDTVPASLAARAWMGRPRAVVIDDNEVNLLVAGGLLQLAGFDVQSASSGEDGIERCRTHIPQLVLMDVHMPGMDGLQATRRLRQMQHEGTLEYFPIVAASADTPAMIAAACRSAGMDGTLGKPLGLRAIESELDKLLPGLRGTLTTL